MHLHSMLGWDGFAPGVDGSGVVIGGGGRGMNELAALFLDEAYGDERRRRGRGRASTSGGGKSLDDDARGTTTTGSTATRTRTARTRGASDGRADAHASPSSSSRPPRPPDRGTTTVSGWLASLWDALLAEDGDEWADARRGRGGTLTGARALKNDAVTILFFSS